MEPAALKSIFLYVTRNQNILCIRQITDRELDFTERKRTVLMHIETNLSDGIPKYVKNDMRLIK